MRGRQSYGKQVLASRDCLVGNGRQDRADLEEFVDVGGAIALLRGPARKVDGVVDDRAEDAVARRRHGRQLPPGVVRRVVRLDLTEEPRLLPAEGVEA